MVSPTLLNKLLLLDMIVPVSELLLPPSMILGRESVPTPYGVKCNLYIFGNHLIHGILPS